MLLKSSCYYRPIEELRHEGVPSKIGVIRVDVTETTIKATAYYKDGSQSVVQETDLKKNGPEIFNILKKYYKIVDFKLLTLYY